MVGVTAPSGTDLSTVLQVVELAADLNTLEQISERVGLPRNVVAGIASAHGYPDPDKMTWGRDILRAKVEREGITLPAAPAVDEQPAAWTANVNPDAETDNDPAPDRTPPAQPRLASSAHQVGFEDVPVAKLHPDPDNPRSNVGDLADLITSIREVGLLQPIVAREDPGGHLIIVAGHRRYAALVQMGWPTAPVLVRGAMRSDEVLAAMLVENSHRADLDPIDEARGLAHLRAQLGGEGISQAMLAQRVGRTQVWVSSRLALLSLRPDQQDEVRAGRMRLQDATRVGRAASGRARAASTGHPHLGIDHPLQPFAAQKCRRAGHKARGRNAVSGSGACGECWEEVIRANERESLHGASADRGRCVLCDTPIPTTQESRA